jgi:hypothetical protein
MRRDDNRPLEEPIMPVKINRRTHIAFLAATLLGGVAWLVPPASAPLAIAQESQSAAQPRAADTPTPSPYLDDRRLPRPAEQPQATGTPAPEAPAKEAGQPPAQAPADHGAHHPQPAAEATAPEAPQPQGAANEVEAGGGGGMMGGGQAGTKHDHDAKATKNNTTGAKAAEMRKMMHEMMADLAARADERLAVLRKELAITDAQVPNWNAFAAAVGAAAKSMEQNHKDMIAAEAAAATPAGKPAPEPEPSAGGDVDYPDKAAVKKLSSASAAQAPEHGLPGKLAAHERMLNRHIESLKAIAAALGPLYGSFDEKQKAIADGLKIGPFGSM